MQNLVVYLSVIEMESLYKYMNNNTIGSIVVEKKANTKPDMIKPEVKRSSYRKNYKPKRYVRTKKCV